MKRNRVIPWRRNLVCIWLGQLLAMAGTSFVIPFIPIFMREEMGITDESERAIAISLFFSLGLLSFCLSNPLWGMLGDRYGRKIMLLRAYFLNAVTFPLLYFMPNLWSLLAMRMFSSLFAGTVAAAQALVAVTTPDKHQGFALGTLSSSFWSGNMLGMVLGGIVVDSFGYMTSFLLCGGMFLIGGLLTLFFVEENFVPPVKNIAEKKTFRIALPAFRWEVWIVMGLLFVVPFARRCDEPFLPLLVELIGGEDRAAFNTGMVMAAASVGGILSGLVFGSLSDRCKPLQLIVPALSVAGCITIMQAAIDSLIVLGCVRFLLFFAIGGLEPVFLAMLSNTVSAERRGAAFGWCASIRVFGGMFGALLGGAVISRFGTKGVFVFAGILLILIIPISISAVKLIDKLQLRRKKEALALQK